MKGPTTSPGRAAAFCACTLAAAVGLFFLIRHLGEALPSESTGADRPAGTPVAPAGDALPHVLLALATVLLAGRVLGRILVLLGQPPVIGEVVAGICLGPSLLGRVAPRAMEFLLPPTVAPYLGVIAQLGAILYMFLVGLELNTERLKGQAHAAVAIAQGSIAVPFVLGAALALGLYPRLAPAGVPFTSFALFLGIALSVTAFPVLARILTDRGMTRTDLGVLALGCAAVGDVAAWCLLAFVVGVAQASLDRALLVAGLALAYLVFVLVLVRPVAQRWARGLRERAIGQGTVAGVLLVLLLSSLATEAIGIHAVFGAFLFGAVLPHDGPLAHALIRKLDDLVTVLFLPAFFAFTGMRTEISLLSGWEDWLICGLITLAATVGKFGGTAVAGRYTGLDWRTASALGVLMNTRGLMELIVLNIGLDLGVISPALFAMMVLMALATTLATTPALRLVRLKDASAPTAAGAPLPPAAKSLPLS